MDIERIVKAKLNIIVSLGCQMIALVCGFIVPRLLINSYGSEAYGATSSIAQFLAYITLLEGGIGGVARAALYKPLADNDIDKISAITAEIKHFFKIIGIIFFVYVIILAISFKSISDVKCFDWLSSALLVIVISISIFGQYFIGISNSILLQAAQRQYISNTINIVTTVLNTICVVVLVFVGSNLIIVKLVSSFIFFMRPVWLSIYVKKTYRLNPKVARDKNSLNQKWNGLSQHIAYFLHSNTDLAVLTIFGNLTLVAVYAVYQMVVGAIQNLTSSFMTGMEALFGDMLAKKEIAHLHKTFCQYETLISCISMIMFGSTTVLILPFINIYTKGVTDANYSEPIFAILLTLSSLLYCLRTPYHSVTIAAGHFKETQKSAFGEAIINFVSSVFLVTKFGLTGVAIGTILAIMFRFAFYIVYLSHNIMNRPINLFIKRFMVNVANFIVVYVAGQMSLRLFVIENYITWVFAGVMVGFLALVITFGFNVVFYHKDLDFILRKINGKKVLTDTQ